MRRCFLVFLLVLSGNLSAQQLTLAVASNFKQPLEALAKTFAQTHDVKVRVSAASTGVLFSQISNGAPFDMFFAADAARPIALEQQGFISANSRKTYAQGQLALWWPAESPELAAALEQPIRLAIANPRHAPYGMAAQKIINEHRSSTHEQLKLITANNIAQAFQFVYTGNADAGFVAVSHLYQHQVNPQEYTIMHQASHLIEQQMVILAASPAQELAAKFQAWVLSDIAQETIQAYGYEALNSAGGQL